jgi:hypothetical protein
MTASPFVRCQWIPGEPSPTDGCKCGAPTMDGEPYCAEHTARSRHRSDAVAASEPVPEHSPHGVRAKSTTVAWVPLWGGN